MFSMTADEFPKVWAELHAAWRTAESIRRCGTQASPHEARQNIEFKDASSLVVLVVDDDSDVREYATAVLTDAGYFVMEAAGGAEALFLLGQVPEIGLMFTDIVMPSMDGFALVRRAKRAYPDLRILYATGYADRLQMPTERYGQVLAKPYRSAQLEAAVRESALR
jgi:CheY-like chemotaxis protein